MWSSGKSSESVGRRMRRLHSKQKRSYGEWKKWSPTSMCSLEVSEWSDGTKPCSDGQRSESQVQKTKKDAIQTSQASHDHLHVTSLLYGIVDQFLACAYKSWPYHIFIVVLVMAALKSVITRVFYGGALCRNICITNKKYGEDNQKLYVSIRCEGDKVQETEFSVVIVCELANGKSAMTGTWHVVARPIF